MAADLAITGATVRTMDHARPISDAVAVEGGRIAAVGAEDVRAATGPKTEVLDLPGRLVMPGFQDAHVHPLWGGLDRLRCDLHDLGTREDYRDAVARYARTHPHEEWIEGGGWAMAVFPRGTPHRRDLDDLVPDRPVFLTNKDGHGAWVNSVALEQAGINARTADPDDGRIERDPDGRPSGTLHEGAMALVSDLIPEPSEEILRRAALEAQRYLHSLGITAWQDAIVEPAFLDVYRALDEGGQLTGRVRAALWWERDRGLEQVEELVERRGSVSGSRLEAGTVKIMLDGVVENFTASMLEPYLDGRGRPTDNRGIPFVDPDSLPGVVTRLDDEGFQVHFHAIGDRAVRDALDAVEAAVAANGNTDHRHHVAHIQVVHPDDVPRFARLGAVANAQALWACHEPQMDDLTIPFLGPERTTHQYPFGSLLRAGATLAMGSDWSVSTPDPFQQMEVAVTRVDPGDRVGAPFLPEERIGVEDAMTAFTRGSAFVNHLDDRTGTIAPGMAADLVVVDRDIGSPEAGPIGDARALLTMVEGGVVHEDPAL
jgi:predicted amidohydrolase YtcJ